MVVLTHNVMLLVNQVLLVDVKRIHKYPQMNNILVQIRFDLRLYLLLVATSGITEGSKAQVNSATSCHDAQIVGLRN